MVDQVGTMPEDVREAFADAVRLFNRWKSQPLDVPAPTIDFRLMEVSLSGICDLVTAYKSEPMPVSVHDELWGLIEDMKLKAELAFDPSYTTGARCLDVLIQDRRFAYRVASNACAQRRAVRADLGWTMDSFFKSSLGG
jgi:hypothetical protein